MPITIPHGTTIPLTTNTARMNTLSVRRYVANTALEVENDWGLHNGVYGSAGASGAIPGGWSTWTTPRIDVNVGGRKVKARFDHARRRADGGITYEGVRPESWIVDDDNDNDDYGYSRGMGTSNTAVQAWFGPYNATTAATTNVWTIRVDANGTAGTAGNVIFHTEPAEPQLLNHRGQPIRSQHKADQWSNVAPEELVALQLLRKMVEPDEFKRYLKHGFVNVRGPSGLIYQIGKQANIKVWDQGELIATLCVHLKDWGTKPPTDEVVAKLIIAECDEPDLWKRANQTWRTTNKNRPRLKLIGIAA